LLSTLSCEGYRSCVFLDFALSSKKNALLAAL
jgi:hypothetical protein